MAVAGSFNLQLQRISRRYIEQAQTSAEELAQEIVVEAKLIAPVDTGTYRSSIEARPVFSLTGALASLFGAGQGAWTWHVVSDVPYAEALELGHSRQAPSGVFGVAASTVRARRGLP